ncbi:unnamed protein product [Dracunculus medinensis]|uniref:MFS domain-containing protein n=1 Tax=Dracunculus medinensis TaxID=318479 RepID=A0A0N4UEN2_DRAME|nr:unnamed protein product [Dracunculus medinensis]
MSVAVIPRFQRYVMLVGRIIMGIGAVVTPLLRSYAIMASSISDRPRAIAEIIGARALGVAIGPSFLNNFLDCYNLEIRIAPIYSATMFNWTRSELTLYTSIALSAFGIVATFIYFGYKACKMDRWIDQRIAFIVGIFAIILFFLITFPWWGLKKKIIYQQEIIWINGTETQNPDPSGCKRSFKWCEYTPAVDPLVYNIGFVVLIGTAFPILDISLNTIYSTIIGPRHQSVKQGLMALFGSWARFTGPVILPSIFTLYGPRIVWLFNIVVAGASLVLWIAFYKKLVPCKDVTKLSRGDVVRTKFGYIYRL